MNAVLNYIQHKLGEPAELRALLKKYSGFAATLEQPPQSIPMCQRSCRLNISEDNHGPLFTRT